MKFRNVVLGIGIFIIYALALWQGVQTFYPAPEYNDYCSFDFGKVPGNNNCVFPPGLNNEEIACANAGGNFRYEYDNQGCVVSGYCDECSIAWQDVQNVYSRNVFVFSLILGVIVFVVGLFILSVEPVGSALLGAGLWSIFYGTALNWRNFSNGLRFGILIVLLVALIFFTLRLNKDGWMFWKKGKKKK